MPWVTRIADGTLRAIAGPDMVVLRRPCHCAARTCARSAEFDVEEGEACLLLTLRRPRTAAAGIATPMQALSRTEAFWREWSDAAHGGECREVVTVRSSPSRR